MLSCTELTESTTDYMERKLPQLERIRFRFHVLICRHCQAYLSQMRYTVAALACLPRRTVDSAMVRRLVGQFRDSPPS